MKTPIDLGMSYEHNKPLPMSEEHYPDFTYESDKPLDLPDAGVMKIKFRKARSSERLMDDHKMHSCTVEVLSIESVKSTKEDAEDDLPVKPRRDAEEALDRLMSEKMGSHKEEDY